MSEMADLKAKIREQQRRLDYAVLQMGREAKFMPESNPENRRFYRAFSCVKEVRDELGVIANEAE